jgi:cobalt/nickel transport system permease protein
MLEKYYGGIRMHIPEGYLSPQTCGVLGAAMLPIWTIASRKTAQSLEQKNVPKLALGAAFSFVIMMFNVPIPDGTTAHAVGATLLAVALGPWAACISITIALVIQALLFGDGGVLAIGANCFNMAFLAPFIGFLSYRLSLVWINNRAIAAGLGAYIGINVAALAAAVEFGLQPILFHAANGAPLYCPYNLAQAIPAMAFAHLTVAGGIEAVVTGLAIYYLQKVGADDFLFPVATKTWRNAP